MNAYNPNHVYIIGDKVVLNGLAYQMYVAPGVAGMSPPNPMYWKSIQMTVDMDLDFSSVWSWTMPLWGLALLLAYLGGVIVEEPVLTGYQKGGRSPPSNPPLKRK
jgi:hypothetical protein